MLWQQAQDAPLGRDCVHDAASLNGLCRPHELTMFNNYREVNN